MSKIDQQTLNEAVTLYVLRDILAEKPSATGGAAVALPESIHINEMGVDEYSRHVDLFQQNKASYLERGVVERAVIFKKIASGAQQPGHPGCPGFGTHYIEHPEMVSFRGVGNDFATFFHMLVVPREHLARCVFDLKFADLPLLERMRQNAVAFFKCNLPWFREHFGCDTLEQLNLQFGFHMKPSVGYLHMHVLAGPLTVAGSTQEAVDRWVSLDTVVTHLQSKQCTPTASREPVKRTAATTQSVSDTTQLGNKRSKSAEDLCAL